MKVKLKNLNLLYIEDDIRTRNNYEKTFNLLFNKVYVASNYQESMSIYENNHIDLALVDIELNDTKDGFDISNKIRAVNSDIQIIFLSSHEEVQFVQKAINSNMNGYIIKPLDTQKFMDIVISFLKKNQIQNITKFVNFLYNFDTCELYDIQGEKIALGKKEHKLIQIFLKNKDKIITRNELEYEIWDEPLSSDSTLKNLIASLRKKIGKDMIINESKIGWRIKT